MAEKRKERIEQYLLGQLKGEALQDFTLDLMRNKKMQEEVEIQRTLMKTLWASNQGEHLSDPPQKGFFNTSKWLLFLLGGIGIVLIAWWWQTPQNTTEQQTPPTLLNDTNTIIGKNILQDSLKLIETSEQETEDSKKPENIPEEKTKAVKEQSTPSPSTSPPIAANFDPNPALESYLGQLRGGELEINSPKQISTAEREDGIVNFQLSGIFTADEKEILIIHFFSNKKEDYEQFRPLLTAELSLEKEEDTYIFQWQPELDFDEGLYYYQIEGEKSGLLYVGKIEIR